MEGRVVTNRNISKAGNIAIALAIIAGVLTISRAIYNYARHGEVDLGKIVLGIGIPLLIYVLMKSSASGNRP